jgi:hypothetical protein
MLFSTWSYKLNIFLEFAGDKLILVHNVVHF